MQLRPPQDFRLTNWDKMGFGVSSSRSGINLESHNMILCVPYWAMIVSMTVFLVFFLKELKSARSLKVPKEGVQHMIDRNRLVYNHKKLEHSRES